MKCCSSSSSSFFGGEVQMIRMGVVWHEHRFRPLRRKWSLMDPLVHIMCLGI